MHQRPITPNTSVIWAKGDNRLLDNFASEQLDNLVESFMSDHGTLVGCPPWCPIPSIFCKSSTGSNQGRVLARLTLETLESFGLS